LNDQPVTKEELATALQSLYATRSERTIFLEADRALSYADVVDVMDSCREAGIERIGIVTHHAKTG
jgi:biopolymer transport protein ExbD